MTIISKESKNINEIVNWCVKNFLKQSNLCKQLDFGQNSQIAVIWQYIMYEPMI